MKEVDYLGEVDKMLLSKKYTRVFLARTMGVSERWIDLMRLKETKPSYEKVIALYKLLLEQPSKK